VSETFRTIVYAFAARLISLNFLRQLPTALSAAVMTMRAISGVRSDEAASSETCVGTSERAVPTQLAQSRFRQTPPLPQNVQPLAGSSLLRRVAESPFPRHFSDPGNLQ